MIVIHRDCYDPVFKQPFKIDRYEKEERTIRFSVYDVDDSASVADDDLLGQVQLRASELVTTEAEFVLSTRDGKQVNGRDGAASFLLLNPLAPADLKMTVSGSVSVHPVRTSSSRPPSASVRATSTAAAAAPADEKSTAGGEAAAAADTKTTATATAHDDHAASAVTAASDVLVSPAASDPLIMSCAISCTYARFAIVLRLRSLYQESAIKGLAERE